MLTEVSRFVGGLPKTIDQVANLTPLDISLTIDEITQVGSDLYVTYYYRTKGMDIEYFQCPSILTNENRISWSIPHYQIPTSHLRLSLEEPW
jgi:hypothetical protein